MIRRFAILRTTSLLVASVCALAVQFTLADPPGGPAQPAQQAPPGSAANPNQPAQPATVGRNTPPTIPVQAPTTQSTPGQGPQIVFDTPSYDFGKIMAGEPVRHDFYFTNRGNATLEVTAVRPGCGCTVAGDWDRKVESGKTGKIPV